MALILLALTFKFIAVVYSRPTQDEINMVFYSHSKPSSSGIQLNSENCLFNLCNDTWAYKEDELKEIIGKHKEFLPLFGNVVEYNKTVTITNRFGEDEKRNMCGTRHVTMFPRQGRTVNDKLKNIVNVEGYNQMVSFEACEENAECFASAPYLPEGVTSSCETQYIVIRLVVINEDRTLTLERFSIPAGCSCMYSQANKYY